MSSLDVLIEGRMPRRRELVGDDARVDGGVGIGVVVAEVSVDVIVHVDIVWF
jgi:hypothetical protein